MSSIIQCDPPETIVLAGAGISVEEPSGIPAAWGLSDALLTYQLMFIQQSLKCGRKGIAEVIEALNLAIEALYPHTNFDRMAHKLYRRSLEGNLTRKEEELINKLRVRI